MTTKENIETKEENNNYKHYKARAITVTRWLNTSDDGKEWSTFTLQRSYNAAKKGETADWKNTGSIRLLDIPVVIELLQKAYNDEIGIDNDKK